MTIIFFVGQGVTEKAIHTEYKNGKYIKNNFINKVKENYKCYNSRYPISSHLLLPKK